MSLGRCLLQRLASRVHICAPMGAGAIDRERELGSRAGCPGVGSDCPGSRRNVLSVVGNGGYGGGGDLMTSESLSFIGEDD